MNNKQYSKRQEKYVANQINGRVQQNSGATIFQKGDIKHSQFLIECKTQIKESKSYRINKKDLLKIQEEAFGMGLSKNDGVLCFNFGDYKENFYIITEGLFKEVINGRESTAR